MGSDVFEDSRLDGLDFFATSLDESAEYEEILKEATHVGWLSMRDFQFMESLIVRVKSLGIQFNFYHTGILNPDDCRRINSELDLFVRNKNNVSKSDQNDNRSVLRLRALLDYSTRNEINLYMVSD